MWGRPALGNAPANVAAQRSSSAIGDLEVGESELAAPATLALRQSRLPSQPPSRRGSS